jgi:hypothetical protein
MEGHFFKERELSKCSSEVQSKLGTLLQTVVNEAEMKKKKLDSAPSYRTLFCQRILLQNSRIKGICVEQCLN